MRPRDAPRHDFLSMVGAARRAMIDAVDAEHAMPYEWSHAAEEQRHAGGTAFGPHRHRHAYAALVVDGSYHEVSADGRYLCTPGTLILHPAHHGHDNLIERGGARTISFPLGAAADEYQDYAVYRSSDSAALLRLARRSLREAIAALPQLSKTRAEEVTTPPWCRAFAQALREGRGCFDLPVSREHASRQFHRHYGLTPRAYRAEWRMRRALQLLRTPDPLADVAADAGYADQSHLTRELRRATGCTPKALRAHASRTF